MAKKKKKTEEQQRLEQISQQKTTQQNTNVASSLATAIGNVAKDIAPVKQTTQKTTQKKTTKSVTPVSTQQTNTLSKIGSLAKDIAPVNTNQINRITIVPTTNDISKTILGANNTKPTTTTAPINTNNGEYTYFGKTVGDYSYKNYENIGQYKLYKKNGTNDYYYYDEKKKKYEPFYETNSNVQYMTTPEIQQREYEKAESLGYEGKAKERLRQKYNQELENIKQTQKNNPTMKTYDSAQLSKKKKKIEKQIEELDSLDLEQMLRLDSTILTDEEYADYSKDLIRQNQKRDEDLEEEKRVKKDTPGLDRIVETGKKIKYKVNKNIIEPAKDFSELYETGKKQNELSLEYYNEMMDKKNNLEQTKANFEKYAMFNQDLINDKTWGGEAIKNLNTQVESIKQQGIAATILAGGGAIIGGAIAGPGGAVTGAKSGAAFGYTFGATPHTYKLEAGNEYQELIELGVSKETAKKYSMMVGALNAAIESGENIVDLLTWGTAGKATKEATTKATSSIVDDIIDEVGESKAKKWLVDKFGDKTGNLIFNTAVSGLISYGQNTYSEGVEEEIQETVSILGERLAAREDNIERNVSWKEDFDRIVDAKISGMVSTAFTGPFMSLGGSVVTTSINNVQSNINRTNIINNAISSAEENLGRTLTNQEKTEITNRVDFAIEETKKLNEQWQEERKKQNLFEFNQYEEKSIKSKNQNVLANEMATKKNTKTNHNMFNLLNGLQKRNDSTQFHYYSTEDFYKMGLINKNSNGEYVMKNGNPYIPRGVNIFNGDKSNIYINSDVGTKSGTQAVFHEIFEGFKTSSPETYNQLKQMVVDIVGENAIQKELSNYEKMYGKELTNDIRDEIINDKFGELAENQNFINKIADNRNLLEKFIDSIKDIVKYIKGTDEEKQLIKLQNKLETEFAKRYKETDFSNGKGNTAYALSKNALSFYEDFENRFKDQLPDNWKSNRGNVVRDILEKNGYDGVINGNNYVVFNSNQIKNIDNTNPTSNEDIRYSLEKNNLQKYYELKEQFSKTRNENILDEIRNMEENVLTEDEMSQIYKEESKQLNGDAYNNIAPIREDISNLTSQINKLSNQLETLKNQTENTSKGYVETAKNNKNINQDYTAMTEQDAEIYQNALMQDEGYLRSLDKNANNVVNEKLVTSIANDIQPQLSITGKDRGILQDIIRDAIQNDLSVDEISNLLEERLKLQDSNIEDYLDNIADTIRNDILEDRYDTQVNGDVDLQKGIQFNFNEDVLPTAIRTQESIDNFIENRDIAPISQEQINKNKKNKNKEKLQQAKRIVMEAGFNRNYVLDKTAKQTGNSEITAKGDKWNNIQAQAEVNISKFQTDINGNKVGDALDTIFEPIEKEGLGNAFNDYLYHRSNIERHAVGKGSQIPLVVSQQLVRQYESENPHFKETAQKVYKFIDNYTKEQLASGLISEQQYKDYRGDFGIYGSYVPFVTVDMDSNRSNIQYDNDGNIKAYSTFKKSKGGAEDVSQLKTIKDAIANQVRASKQAVAFNELAKELVNTFGKYEEAMDIDTRTNPTDMRDLLYVTPDGDKVLTAYVNGEKVSTIISDELYNELSKNGETLIKSVEDAFSPILTPIQKMNNIFRKMVTTWNPVFPVFNAVKDLADAPFNSKHTFKMLKNYLPGVLELAQGKTQDAQQFMANYGIDSLLGDYTNVHKNTLLNKINPFNYVAKLNELIELAPRFAEFKASKQAGESIDQAMYNAREVTLNFGRGGYITKALSRNGYTFLNTNVQGISKIIRNITGQNGIKGYISLAVKGVLFGIAPALLNHLAYGGFSGDDEDEDYAALPDYIKDNYYLIKLEDGESGYDDSGMVVSYGGSKFFRIPKGRIVSVLGSLSRRSVEYAEGDKDAFEGWGKNAWNQIGVGDVGSYSMFAPFKDSKILVTDPKKLKKNPGTTWYGGDIVPTRLQDTPAPEQTDSSIDAVSNFIGKTLGVSPYKVNYLLDQYTGFFGDVLLPTITPETTSGAESFVDYLTAPIKDKFIVNSTDDNKYAGDFYSKKDELEVQSNSINASNNDILKYKYMENVSKEMSGLYKEKREVQADETLSNSEKYKKVQAIQNEINNLAKEGLNNYESADSSATYGKVGDIEYYKNEDGEWKKVNDVDMEFTAGLSKFEKTIYYQTKNDLSAIDTEYKEKTKDLGKNDTKLKKQYSNERKKNITKTLVNSYLDDYTKAMVYSKYYSTKENMTNAYNSGYKINDYITALYDIEQIREKYSQKKGYSTSYRKRKTLAYINSLNMNIPQKAMLVRSIYSSFRTYNKDIVNYVNNLDISYEDKIDILKQNGMTIKGNRVTWK